MKIFCIQKNMVNKNEKFNITCVIANILQNFEFMQGKVVHYISGVNLCVLILDWIVK